MNRHVYKTVLTQQDFEAVHGVKNNNSMICLSAMFYGNEITLGERTYRLFPCTHGGFKIGVVNNKQEMVAGLDFTIEAFTRLCENVHPEQMDTIVNRLAFSKVVTANNQSVNRHRVRSRSQHEQE